MSTYIQESTDLTGIDPVSVSERQLQAWFESIGSAGPSVAFAGVPRWMSRAARRNSAQRIVASGYDFVPDVVWETEDTVYVFELKSAAKYQSVGLPEVLHHAKVLQEGYGTSRIVKPVLMSRPSDWLRASVDYLHANGFHPSALKYFEFQALTGTSRPYVWLDDPFDGWAVTEEIPELPPSLAAQFEYWYRMESSDTWFGTSSYFRHRPLTWPGSYMRIARLSNDRGLLVHSVGSHGDSSTIGAWHWTADTAQTVRVQLHVPERRWHWVTEPLVEGEPAVLVSDEVRRQRDLD
jgi:hypothetical protein